MNWLALIFIFLVPAARAATPSMYGEILSPNYPQGYPNNVEEFWTVTVPPGYGIRIYFTHLDIELSENCGYDSVQIVIGDVVEATLCGQTSSQAGKETTMKYDKYFPSNTLTMTFKSDFSNHQRYTGFAAYYVAEDVNECEDQLEDACSHFCNNYIGGYFCSCPPEYFLHDDNRSCGVNCSGTVYTELKGEISSPNYPNPYPENSRCEYRIQLEFGYQIVVTFHREDFDIESNDSGDCSYDSLLFKANGRIFGPFCGRSVPNPPKIETQSNTVDIIFQTDSGGANKGWKIRYYEEAVPCPNLVLPNSILEPRQPKYVFKDVVTVVCLKGYEVIEGDVSKRSFRTECRDDGQWSRTKPHCQPLTCIPPEYVDNAELMFLSGPENYDYLAEIRYSCREPYYKMVSTGNGIYSCSADGEWVNSQAGTALPTCASVCGVSVDLLGTGRIFGGITTKEGMFPWQVFIQNPRGGGALISDEWVLTAAHVVDEEENPTMYAGIRDLKDIRPRHQLVAKKVFFHDKWKRGVPEPRTDYDNDIALIKLETKVALSDMVSPLCLPGPGPEYILEEGKIGAISGWGKTEEKDKARILHMASISVVKMADCQNEKTEIGDSSQYVFSSNMICAGGSGKDSCQGDSGGAFVVRDPHNDTLYFAAGIVSWGPKCGTFGLYTNVRNYLDWIKKTMMDNKDT